MTRLTTALFAGALLCAPAVAVAAGQPLQIEDAVTAREFHVQGVAPMFSPDGRWVSATVCDPAKVTLSAQGDGNIASMGAAYRSMGCDIHLHTVNGRGVRNLTQGGGNNWGPSWSPDGVRLAFYSDRDGKPGLWLWDRDGDKIRKVTDAVTRHRLGFEAPVWTPDGRGLIVKLRPEGAQDVPFDIGSIGDVAVDDREPGSTVVLFQSPRPAPKAGAPKAASNAMQADLGLVDLSNGAVRPLIKGVVAVGYKLSPDGRYLLVIDQQLDDPNYAVNMIVVEVATGKIQSRFDRIVQSFAGAVSWSPDSRRLAYVAIDAAARRARAATADATSINVPEGGDLFIASAETGAASKVEGAANNVFLSDYLAPLWDAKGERLYVVDAARQVWKVDAASRRAQALNHDRARTVQLIVSDAAGYAVAAPDDRFLYVSTRHKENRKNGFATIDVDSGRMTVLQEEGKVYGGIFSAPVFSPDRKHVLYLAESSQESGDLWISDAALRAPRRLTTINPQLSKYKFGRSQIIDFKSSDGRALRAGVLLPSDYRPGRRYPTVLWVYASDEDATRFVNSFGLVPMQAFNMQMFATRGYAVMWPDIPTHKGTPMKDLMKAVMPAIDRLAELGIADPDRLAVMGNSNGGYSTLALIAQTNRFKAAVSNSGFGDLGAFYGVMGGGWIPWLERLGGSMGVPPWEAPALYVENSPYYQLNRIETPLLIQAGAADAGIVNHSDAVWVGMQRLNKETIYLRYGGEGHVLASAANLKDYWRRLFVFFDKHVRSRPIAASN